MWRRRLFFIVVVLLFTAEVVVSKAPPQELKLGEDEAGQTFFLPVGSGFAVVLTGNPSTGYLWEVTPFPEALLKQTGYIFDPHPAPATMVGVGGRFTFRFQAVGPGVTRLEFRYRRPWEKDVPPAKIFYVDLEIR